MHAGYPDLAAGEAYLSLLLLDEIADESAEWHEQTVQVAAIEARDELHNERQSDCGRQLEDGDMSREADESISSEKSIIIRRWEQDT